MYLGVTGIVAVPWCDRDCCCTLVFLKLRKTASAAWRCCGETRWGAPISTWVGQVEWDRWSVEGGVEGGVGGEVEQVEYKVK